MQTLYRPCTWGEEAGRYASRASVTLGEDHPVQDLCSPFARVFSSLGPEQTLYRPCTGCQLPLTALAFWSRCQALQRPVQALYRVSVTKAAILVIRPLQRSDDCKGVFRACAGSGRSAHDCCSRTPAIALAQPNTRPWVAGLSLKASAWPPASCLNGGVRRSFELKCADGGGNAALRVRAAAVILSERSGDDSDKPSPRCTDATRR